MSPARSRCWMPQVLEPGMGVVAGPRPPWLLGRGWACPRQHVSCRRHGPPAWAWVQLCAFRPQPAEPAHPARPLDLPFLPRGAFEAPGKLAGSADTALRGCSVGLGSERVGEATQAASPYLPPTSELVLPQEVRRRGAHSAPRPARAGQSFPRRGPASRPHVHRGSTQRCWGPPQGGRAGCGQGAGWTTLAFPAPRTPRPAPLKCACVGGAWGRGGGRHTALGPARVLARGTGTRGGGGLSAPAPRAAPRPYSQLDLEPRVPPPPPQPRASALLHDVSPGPRGAGLGNPGLGAGALSCLPVLHPGFLDARAWLCPEPGYAAAGRDSPREDQAEQGAEEDEDLVEHGRLGAQDGTVEVVLREVASSGAEQGLDGAQGPSPPPPPRTSQMHENEW